MAKAVFCIASSLEQAETIVERLRTVGFESQEISVLFPDRSGTKDFAHEKHTKAPEGAVTGVGAGGIVGGTLGYLAGIGALTIPGVGPLIAAGPIMAMLSGAAVGGTVGGMTGALVGMGIPEFEAKRYAGKVKDGNILISAHTDDRKQVSVAKAVFNTAGATDISTAGEESTDADGETRSGERLPAGEAEADRNHVRERARQEGELRARGRRPVTDREEDARHRPS